MQRILITVSVFLSLAFFPPLSNAGVAAVDLTPLTATNPVGTSHTVDAEVNASGVCEFSGATCDSNA